jgi:hypothetical protein
MTSYLNLFGTSALYANVILKLTSNDNFVNLVSDINENGVAEYNERLIVKAMYEFFDPIIIPYLQKDENKKLFHNTGMSKEIRIKTCVVKLVTHLHNTYSNDLQKNFGIQMVKNKTEFIKDTSEELCVHININKVDNYGDIYKILLEYYGLKFSKLLTQYILALTTNIDPVEEDQFYSHVDFFTKRINETYTYTPYLYQSKDNDSDSDSDGDGEDKDKDKDNTNKNTDDDNTDKDPNEQEKNSTKRSRDDNNNDTSDPKKRRNE